MRSTHKRGEGYAYISLCFKSSIAPGVEDEWSLLSVFCSGVRRLLLLLIGLACKIPLGGKGGGVGLAKDRIDGQKVYSALRSTPYSL